MSFPRASGILLHITSLPGRYGIGDLGAEAYRFADFLVAAGQRLWQILPLGPTGIGNSPYESFSAFAGNPIMISLGRLIGEGLLTPADLENIPHFPEGRVDYNEVNAFKTAMLKKAFDPFRNRATPSQNDSFETFVKTNTAWLDSYALFMALRDTYRAASWNTWPEDIRKRDPEALERWRAKLTDEQSFQRYMQWLFFRQWAQLKQYCNERGISFVGDMAHFVALDSAEVWSRQEMFRLDSDGNPEVIAGVPPDYFSKTGQRWGNPVYRWDVMAEDGYSWWIERLRMARTQTDIIRLDHFRGFEKYWEIPVAETTAVNGRWVEGPGLVLFETAQRALGNLPIIAEDLGWITPEVVALKERTGFPGMKVLQFAFDNDSQNPYLPHNFPRNCVVYTGTHDNDTTVGWSDTGTKICTGSELEKCRQFALKYTGTDGHEINWDFIRLALASVADMAVFSLQDVLGLGSEARMNTPGTVEGNWVWRFREGMLTNQVADRLKELTGLYSR